MHTGTVENAVSRESIERAAERILGFVRVTPTITLDGETWAAPNRIVLKLESLQHAGSFKARGAFNRMLSAIVPTSGVIAASGGNHGLAVAYAARELGCRAEIFVPVTCPPAKLRALERYGAHIIAAGDEYAQALEACVKRQVETGALMVHAYDQPEVVAGQGTLARELDEQAAGLDTILVAVGGGGLIGGIAAWFDRRVRVIGVEPRLAPTLASALATNAPVDVAVGGIAADALGARRAGTIAFRVAQKAVERVVLVEDEEIVQAQRALWDELRLIAEPGGATALAALLSGRYRPEPAERMGIVICGANVAGYRDDSWRL